MHVYNTIIILKELLPVFPLAAVSITDTGASLDAAMDRFLESEDRGDLKILGRAYVFLEFFSITVVVTQSRSQLFCCFKEERVVMGNAKKSQLRCNPPLLNLTIMI